MQVYERSIKTVIHYQSELWTGLQPESVVLGSSVEPSVGCQASGRLQTIKIVCIYFKSGYGELQITMNIPKILVDLAHRAQGHTCNYNWLTSRIRVFMYNNFNLFIVSSRHLGPNYTFMHLVSGCWYKNCVVNALGNQTSQLLLLILSNIFLLMIPLAFSWFNVQYP